jgi:predicted short-subunit dehydrogenase-like oxidoreductase (DUF2520 family)
MPSFLSIVGAGRVGRALGRALRRRGWRIGAVVTRSSQTAHAAVRFIGGGKAAATISANVLDADVILITTPDGCIAEAARKLALAAGSPPRGGDGMPALRGKVILHCSGALDRAALAPLERLGAATGSMHPFQTFGNDSVPELRGVQFTVEGAPRAVRMARRIARALGGVPVAIRAGAKPAYHCAGAFSAAHLLSLMEAATQMLERLGFPRRLAQAGLLRMARETLRGWETRGPRATWTGPVARGDYDTIARHFAALRGYPRELRDAHAALLRLSARVIAANPAPVLKRLERVTGRQKKLPQRTLRS